MTSAGSPKSRDALATLRIPDRDTPRRPSLLLRLMRGGLVLGLLAAVCLGGFVWAQRSGLVGSVGDLVPDAIRSLPEVRVARVAVERGRSADAVVVATGYLESRRQAKIGARAAGRIEVVNVEEGSPVKSGEVIAVLEHRDMDAALAAAEATLERARAELAEQEIEIARTQRAFERAQKLYASNTISDEEYDQARFQFEGAKARRNSLQAAVSLQEARVDESRQFQENMIIRAPFDGTVISKDAEVGESILPGGMGEASGRGSVVTIADLAHLEVDCDVKEDYIGRVVQGRPAEVAVDAVPDRRYAGRVRKIIPMGDRARATIKVKVEILEPDGRLFPDMSSTVYFLPSAEDTFDDDDKPRIFCDNSAIQAVEDRRFVWRLDSEDRVERVDVTVVGERDGRAEIEDGLEGGDRVIVNPPPDLSPGTLVRIRS